MPVMSGLADTTLLLNSGARIPQVGLGVWQTPSGATTRQAVTAALKGGYRHVDTARIAENGALFDFTLDDGAMKALDALEEGLVTGWDPAEQP